VVGGDKMKNPSSAHVTAVSRSDNYHSRQKERKKRKQSNNEVNFHNPEESIIKKQELDAIL
jgi:hypothetical protein